MTKKNFAAVLLCAFALLTACGVPPAAPENRTELSATQAGQTPPAWTQETPSEDEQTERKEERIMDLQMTIDGTPVSVDWEQNAAVETLRALCADGDLTVALSAYGGFEQVGPLGTRLPASDTRMTTAPGDLVLYAGNQLVVFFGPNTWSYTKLGHITDLDEVGLMSLLDHEAVTVVLSLR